MLNVLLLIVVGGDHFGLPTCFQKRCVQRGLLPCPCAFQKKACSERCVHRGALNLNTPPNLLPQGNTSQQKKLYFLSNRRRSMNRSCSCFKGKTLSWYPVFVSPRVLILRVVLWKRQGDLLQGTWGKVCVVMLVYASAPKYILQHLFLHASWKYGSSVFLTNYHAVGYLFCRFRQPKKSRNTNYSMVQLEQV